MIIFVGYTIINNMTKRLCALLCLGIILVQAPCEAGPAKRDKKNAKTETVKKDTTARKRTSKYEKTFVKDKNCVTARCKDGFMTLHKSKGKLYIELPVKYLGREMMIASTITSSSAADLASLGYKPTQPLHVRFAKVDSTIFMNEVTDIPDYDHSNFPMGRAVKRSSMDPILNSFKLNCYNRDSSAVVFEVTSMFAANYDKFAPVKSGTSGGINMTATYNSAGTALGEIKAFEDNVSIRTTLSYKVTADFMKLVALKKDQPFSVEVTRTILLLPEEKMRPRFADSRLGIFVVDRLDLESDVDRLYRYSVLKRWNVQPRDTAAWQRGELVEPVKPIVYYLDDAFPELWREPLRKGILRWNSAFGKIGLKNVIQVRDFPTDDPSFDPDNLKYSCVRYVPSMIANAMGPSWCDPTTGEIINASVIIYNDVVKLVNGWRFNQTAQLDPRAREKKMPDSLLQESIEYIVAHEIGHTLGFMHNMAASAAYPVDSLRSATFTAKYGTTASIMDYARFNYVAQPTDKGVRLSPPDLGPYDEFLVKYTYCPVPEARTSKQEADVISGWVDSVAGDPIYRYGRQQVIKTYDPSALSEDLGDDPIKASDYGIANLKYILAHFDEWMPDSVDPDATLRTYRYEELAKQYNRYLGNVLANVGGVYLTAVKPGTPGRTAVAVDKATQHASLLWVIDQLRNCSWIENRTLTDKFTMRLELHSILQYYTALEVFESSHNVMLSSRIADTPAAAYTLEDWCNDLYTGIWGNVSRGSKLSDADRILQSLHVQYLCGIVSKKTQLVKMSSSTAFCPSVDRIIALGLDGSGLVEKYAPLLRDLDEQYGRGYVASRVLEDDSFGAPGYGFQAKVNLRTVDNSKELYYAQLLRIRNTLKSAASASSGPAKAHYQTLLHEIDVALDDK